MNPIITVNAELTKLLVEYKEEQYATNRLTVNPTIPESRRFLLRDIVLLLFRYNFVMNVTVSDFLNNNSHRTKNDL